MELAKYLRYVLNDFFVIAMMFFVGGLGYEYSNLLKTLHPGLAWTNWVILIVLFLSVQIGRYATFLKQPDYVFLLPEEYSLHQYLKQSFNYSLLMAGIIQILVWFILLPFIEVTNHANNIDLISYLIMILVIKFIWLSSNLMGGYRINIYKFNRTFLLKWLLPFITISVAVFVNPLLGCLISIIFAIAVQFKLNQWSHSSLDWLFLINNEEKRMHDLYQFFNLFTDVPKVNPKPKRRKYLDRILNQIHPTQKNIYLYLYSRGISRDSKFSNLYLRLTIIGMVLLLFIHGEALPLFLNVLFIYMIGFQLIPFYFHFDDNVFMHIYPLDQTNQIQSFERIITGLLLFSSILFWIVSFIANLSVITSILILIIDLVEIYIFKRFYIRKRIQKN